MSDALVMKYFQFLEMFGAQGKQFIPPKEDVDNHCNIKLIQHHPSAPPQVVKTDLDAQFGYPYTSLVIIITKYVIL